MSIRINLYLTTIYNNLLCISLSFLHYFAFFLFLFHHLYFYFISWLDSFYYRFDSEMHAHPFHPKYERAYNSVFSFSVALSLVRPHSKYPRGSVSVWGCFSDVNLRPYEYPFPSIILLILSSLMEGKYNQEQRGVCSKKAAQIEETKRYDAHNNRNLPRRMLEIVTVSHMRFFEKCPRKHANMNEQLKIERFTLNWFHCEITFTSSKTLVTWRSFSKFFTKRVYKLVHRVCYVIRYIFLSVAVIDSISKMVLIYRTKLFKTMFKSLNCGRAFTSILLSGNNIKGIV